MKEKKEETSAVNLNGSTFNIGKHNSMAELQGG